MVIVLDVFTRSVRCWSLSYSLDQQLTLEALKMVLGQGTPLIHHSDQGVQYAAYAYIDLLKAHGVQISMPAVGKAEENGCAERFIRTIKEDEVALPEYNDFADANHQIGRFIQEMYMTKRIHSSLGYQIPTESEDAYRSSLDSQRVKISPLLIP